VNVKISRCPKCKQPVRMTVSHMMDGEEKKEFYDEARKYDLNIEEVPLLEYRKMDLKFCDCNK